MQITTTNPIINSVGYKSSSEVIKEDHDELLFDLGNALNRITEGKVEFKNPIFFTGEPMSELSTTPEDIVWKLHRANIRLPDSIIETLNEWKNKIEYYAFLLVPLNEEEKDKLGMHLTNLKLFLLEEVVNPALLNTYPSLEGK